MKNNVKRWLALFLCAMMVVTSGIFTTGSSLRATDENDYSTEGQTTDASIDVQDANTDEQAAAETQTVTEEQPAAEDTAVTPAEDDSQNAETVTEETGDQTAADTTDAVSVSSSSETDSSSEEKTDEELAEESYTYDKKTYSYDDDNVTVTVTLERPDAVPDQAEFKVTQITSGQAFEAYIAALNANASDGQEYTADNTLLYDVAFLVPKYDEEGNAVEGERVEYEPAAGSVTVKFDFKKSQLTNGIGADSASDVGVKHLSLDSSVIDANGTTADSDNISADQISVSDTKDDSASGDGTIQFATDSFSVFAFTAGAEDTSESTDDNEGNESDTSLRINVRIEDADGNEIQGATLPENEFAVKVNKDWSTNAYSVLSLGVNEIPSLYNVGFNYYTWRYEVNDVAFSDGSQYYVTLYEKNQWSNYSGFPSRGDNVWNNMGDSLSNGSEVTIGGDTYKVVLPDTLTFNSSDNSIDIIFRKNASYNLSADLTFDQNATITADDGYWLYVQAPVTDANGNSGTGYYLKPFTVDGQTEATVDISEWTDNSGNTQTYAYDGTSDQNTVVRLVKASDSDPSLNSVINGQGGRIEEGGLVSSFKVSYGEKVQAEDSTSDVKHIVMPVTLNSLDKVSVDLTFDQNATITADDGYWLYVQAPMEDGSYGYYLKPFTVDGKKEITVDISEWADRNNNVKSDYIFDGNSDSDVTVRLVKASGTSVGINNVQDNSGASRIEEGGLVRTYKVSYGARTEEANGSGKHIIMPVTLSTVVATNDYNFLSILGPGVNYGINSEHYVQKHEIQSNFATNDYTSNGNEFQPNLSGKDGKAGSSVAVTHTNGKVRVGSGIAGSVAVFIDDEQTNLVTDDGSAAVVIGMAADDIKNNIVDPILNHGAAISAELGAHAATLVPTTENGKIYLDTTAFADGTTIYVDADSIADVLAKGGSALNITKRPDQVIVFNFASSSPKLYDYNITEVGSDGKVILDNQSSTESHGLGVVNDTLNNSFCQKIVFNVEKGSLTLQGSVAGMYLVPNGDTYCEASSTGWIICGGTTTTNNEWHNVYSDMPDVSTATLNLYKTVDGANAKNYQKFVFELEKYNTTSKEWETISTAENNGSLIEFTAKNELSDGYNAFRIHESGLSETTSGKYTIDDRYIYSRVEYKVYPSIKGTTSVKVAKTPEYYESFDESAFTAKDGDGFSEKIESPANLPTFNNKTKKAGLSIGKKVEGTSDKDTLFTFHVTLKEPQVDDETGEAVTDAAGNTAYVPVTGEVKTSGVGRYSSVTFDANGEADIQLKADETISFEGLKAGSTYYVIQEDEPEGYTSDKTDNKVEGTLSDEGNEEVFTNTYVEQKVSVSGTKTWNDNNNSEGKRPESITVNLIAGGEKVASKTVTAADNWSYTFSDLDKTDSNGNEIEYSVTEDPVTDYTTTYDGYNIVNTIEEKTQISVTKVWDDNDNQDGIRGKSVQVQLYKDGTAYGTQQTLNDANEWRYTWTELPAKSGDEDIVYTVKEIGKTEGYSEGVVTGNAENGFVITNTHTPETTSVSGAKTWNDNNDQDGARPSEITVRLLANGSEAAKKTVKASDGWKYTFDNLPAYSGGQPIKYTVTEDSVENYNTDISGYNITNTHAPDKTSVSVTKAWDDSNNQDGKRPESVTVYLLADGQRVSGKDAVLSAANSWTYTWNDLDAKKAGKNIAYTVEEVEVDGYTGEITGSAANGFVITNSHTAEKTTVSGTKTWSDNDDQDGVRPDSVTIRLLADGTEVASSEVKAADNWRYSFENLPKYNNGKEIKYTVTEDAVSGYTTSISGYDVTNTHTPGETSVTVTKAWNDNNNQDGKRPDSVNVQLYADGEAYGDAVALSADNSWTHTWSGLAEMKAGQKIAYTVRETEKVSGYDSVITGDADKGYTITNIHETETVTVSGTKTWDDNDDQDGVRPDNITVKLLADGDVYKTTTVTAADNWSYSFDKLPKYKDGKEIRYTVSEDAVEGYPASYSGNNIRNTHTTDTTSVTVRKSWEDGGNQDGKRSDGVQVQLYANGTAKGETVTLSESNDWTYTWENLDKKSGGNDIAYTVEEVSVPDGYEAAVTKNNNYDFTIANTHTPETVSYSVTKVWSDDDNQDGLRPGSVSVQLKAGDTAYGSPVVLSDEAGWTYTWNDLPAYSEGEPVSYSVDEVSVPEGYTKSVTHEGTAYTITNIHESGKTGVSVNKKWVDDGNRDGVRPSSITVQLYKTVDGVKSAVENGSVVLSENNNWQFSWTDLPQNEAGKAVTYSVDETSVPSGYTKEVTGSGTSFTITNTHEIKTTSYRVNKVWNDDNNQDGIRPASIRVQLKAGSEDVGEAVTLSAGNGWSHEWTGLPVNENGTAIEYSVEEVSVPDSYSVGYSKTVADGETVYTVKNTHTSRKTGISVTKIWDDDNNRDGIRPASVEVQLYKNGTAEGDPVELNAGNGWSYSWSGLAERSFGKAIAYSVREVTEVSCYTSEAANNGTAWTITNRHESKKTSYSVTKIWDDDDNRDGMRPDSIEVQLYRNGTAYGSPVTLSEENGWAYTWSGLYANENGEEISYSVDEISVPAGYTKSYTKTVTEDGTSYTFTNSHESGKTGVSVNKVWDDGNNQDGMRPASIEVQLYSNGKASGDPVTLDESNGWAYSWTGLPVNENGTAVDYSVDEISVPDGYTKTVDHTEGTTSYTIKNTHAPAVTEISGTKTWNDNNDQDGARPDSITVILYADGAEAERKAVTASDGWSYSFTGLPVYKNGNAVTYTVDEVKVADYSKQISGYDLINTHNVGKTSVSVRKAWDDADNQDGIRPESVTVQLLADGKASGDPVTLNAANKWSYTWPELDAKKDGKAISYTVEESGDVSGYTTAVTGDVENGFVITNSHAPATRSVAGTKTWNDNNDQDGVRPESITVSLYADGVLKESRKVTAADSWSYSFDDLPVYADGKVIVYTIGETVSADYTGKTEGYDLVNTHKTGKTSVSVHKVWNDSNNQDGVRPESVTVQLKADGQNVGEAVELSEKNSWAYTWEDLDAKKNGKAIAYTVDETGDIGEYTKTITGDQTTGFVITNSYTAKTTEISGTKTWNDNDDQDGARPDSITVRLYADGKEIRSTVATADNNWNYSFGELPVYSSGNKVEYSVSEDTVADYQPELPGNGYDLVNDHEVGKTSVTVRKSWDDNDDQDGVRPDSVKVQLLADGKNSGKAVELSDENGWTYTWSDLDAKKDGADIVYTVEEVDVDKAYTAVVSGDQKTGFVITNSHTTETTEISGTKTWEDSDDQDGIRPETITVNLYADDVLRDSKTVTADENGSWKYSFSDLPVNTKGEDGKSHRIEYTVDEVPVNGYETKVSGYDLTNTHETDKTDISVEKIWDDRDDQDGMRPDEIEVQLTADNAAADVDDATVTLSEENNWSYTWTDLPVNADGKAISYSVDEVSVPDGYTKSVGVDGTKYTITNTHETGKTGLSVKKVWDDLNDLDGIRPDSVEVQLTRNGEAYGEPVTLDEEKGWTYSWTGLDEKEAGKTIEYSVDEVDVPDGYEKTVTNEGTAYVITNTHEADISTTAVIRGSKGLAGGDINAADGQFRFTLSTDAAGRDVIDTAKNDGAGNFSFAAIKYDEAGTYTYYVKEINAGRKINGVSYGAEAPVPVTVTVTAAGNGRLEASVSSTASFSNEALTSIPVTKVWDDDSDAAGYRPASVTVQLLMDGAVYRTAVLTAENAADENTWTYTFENIPAGHSYAVNEVNEGVDCYDVTVDQSTYTITNSFIHPDVDIIASKVITGSVLRDGQFTFELYRNSEPDTAVKTISNTASGEIIFSGIEYDENGYTIKEVKGTDSHVTYDEGVLTYDGEGNLTSEKTEFTNTYRPIVLRVRKTSKEEPNDPLVNAHYALYQVGENGGNDIKIETQTSDANGYMYYGKIQPGVLYYFKEEAPAPEGHEVDPYPSAKFQVQYTDNGEIEILDENGNPTTVGDITSQDSSKLNVQYNTETQDIDKDDYTLSYEDDSILAVATSVDGAFPEGTKMVVRQLSGDSASSAESILAASVGEVKSVVFYDVSFTDADGNEIEPAGGDVTVTIQPKAGVDLDGAAADKLKIVHLRESDGQVVDVDAVGGSVAASGDRLLETSFTSDTFSTFGVVEPGESSTLGGNYLVSAAGVADQVSELKVAKLDTSGKYVIGAHMQIIEQSTGRVVYEWNTNEGAKDFARWFIENEEPMNTGVRYVLHEASAPEGYELADDIMFTINEYDSSITVYSYDESGNLVLDQEAIDKWTSDHSLTMIDVPVETETVTKKVQKTVPNNKTIQGEDKVIKVQNIKAVKTGDTTPIITLIVILAAAAVLLVVLLRKKKAQQ